MTIQHTLEYEKIPSSFKELVTDETAFKQLNKLDWVATVPISGLFIMTKACCLASERNC